MYRWYRIHAYVIMPVWLHGEVVYVARETWLSERMLRVSGRIGFENVYGLDFQCTDISCMTTPVSLLDETR